MTFDDLEGFFHIQKFFFTIATKILEVHFVKNMQNKLELSGANLSRVKFGLVLN